MLPVLHGKKHTIKSIVKYSFVMYMLSLLPYFFSYSGQIYLVLAMVLGGIFIFLSMSLKADDNQSAKYLFRYSILYLFLLYLALIIDAYLI